MNTFELSDFLKSRQSGLGGSDISTLFGINPYSTKLELYLQKRGEIEPTADTRLTRTGRAMEQVIAVMVAEREGAKLRKVNRTLRHPKHDFLIAHIDRDYVGIRKGLEIKNVSPRMAYLWGKDGQPDAVAEHYLPQPHHYMLVLDYDLFDVAAYFGGDDLRIYPMERDPEMDELIIDAAHDFGITMCSPKCRQSLTSTTSPPCRCCAACIPEPMARRSLRASWTKRCCIGRRSQRMRRKRRISTKRSPGLPRIICWQQWAMRRFYDLTGSARWSGK